MKRKIVFFTLSLFLNFFSNNSYCQFSANFTPDWAECLGQNGSYYETVNCAILHSNGYVYCVGYTVNGVHDFFISKVSPTNGVEVFSSSPLISASTDILHSVAESSDSTLIAVGVVGNHSSLYPNYYGAGDLVVARFNQDGLMTNIKTFGGTKIDRAYSVICNSDSTIVIAGKTASIDNDFSNSNSHGGVDGLVMKLDYNFDVIWKLRVGTAGEDCFNRIIKSRDGNYLCVGYSVPDTLDFNKRNVMFCKVTNSGTALSTKYYFSTMESSSTGISLAEDSINGNIFIVGTNYDNYMAAYGSNSFIIKTNFNGTQIKRVDYAYNNTSSFRDLVIVDNTLYIVGEIPLNVRKMGIYIFDENLNNISQTGYLTIGSNDVPYSILYYDNSFILAGMCYGSAGSVNYWNNYSPTSNYDAAILKVSKSSALSLPEFESKNGSFVVYPNPSSDFIFLLNNSAKLKISSIKVLDILGRELICLNNPNNIDKVAIDIHELKEGLYVMIVNNEYSIKFIKE
ncbi:MAG: T9SS type A sorting domain-containing protein [Bacteroidetes bacterium]|nr:T9SS type A sorting domain-containing protein [Bacteroidota bacterium]